MEQIKNKVEDDFLNKKNVVGVGLGQKWTRGHNTGKDAILVFVEKKINKNKLSKSDIIPPSVNGVKTDVVGRTGVLESQAVYTKKTRPLMPGHSCGHYRVTAGTIGGFFKDEDGEIVGLSNNHVLANSNNAIAEKHITLQPGKYDDGGWIYNVSGTLWKFQRLVDSGGRVYNFADDKWANGYNLEDSAIFRLGNGYFKVEPKFEEEIPKIGFIEGWNDDVKVGDYLQKTGRTTGYKKEKVIATSMSAWVIYGSNTRYLFKDQIATNSMSAGGDSGSLVLDMANNAAGLLFAGSSSTTLINKIRYPREAYKLQIIGSNISETINYVLTVDGKEMPNSYKLGDFNKAVKSVREQARQGKNAKLRLEYDVAPID